MPKRIFLVFSALLALALPTMSQVRDYVAIVRPNISADNLAFLEKLSSSLRSQGYAAGADRVDDYSKGGYGSGFVFVDAVGANFIVTNRHVVTEAGSATVEFEKADGSRTTFPDCIVVARDENLDLALIALPKGTRPFKKGLSITASRVDEGAEVWSAGFPGLGSTPLWQFGKGNVTNNQARIPELADPAVTTLVQHSAQVDPGNSGGPLLIADAKATSGYRVVGVNTWKAVDRQATNFAIPAAAVSAFVDRSAALGQTRLGAKELEARSRSLLSAGSDYHAVARLVSYSLVTEVGQKAFTDMLDSAPTEDRDTILAVFLHSSPIEALRLSLGYSLVQTLSAKSENPPVFVGVEGELPGERGSANFTVGGKAVASSWVVEGGVWRMTNFSLLTEKKEKEGAGKGLSGVYFSAPFTLSIGAGVRDSADLPLRLAAFANFNLGAFSALNFDFSRGEVPVADYFGQTKKVALSQVGMGWELQAPLSFDDFFVAPYVDLRYLMAIDFGGVADLLHSTGFGYGIGLYGGLYALPNLAIRFEYRVNPKDFVIGGSEAGLFLVCGI